MEPSVKEAFMRLNNRIKTLEESLANNKPRTVTEYSQECDKIAAALSNASKSLKPLTKESKGNHHKYSSLEEMYEALEAVTIMMLKLLKQPRTDKL